MIQRFLPLGEVVEAEVSTFANLIKTWSASDWSNKFSSFTNYVNRALDNSDLVSAITDILDVVLRDDPGSVKRQKATLGALTASAIAYAAN